MKVFSRFKLSTPGVIALSMLAAIFAGTFLLALPIASSQRTWTGFLSALFTATSAVCVTGLSVLDICSHFSLFGQIVILVLVQIGGLGFITFLSLFRFYVKKKSSLSERKLAMQSVGGMRFDEIKQQLKTIFIGTLFLECLGAILLSVAFVQDFGWGKGIWNGIFTAVSAFCNAGFTLTDGFGQTSLLSYASNALVSLTVCALVIAGGIGFFVWCDLKKNKLKFKNYSLQTKTVLVVTGILIAAGWALFALFEWNNPSTIGSLRWDKKILAALFMSVTPRTAGFANVNYAMLSHPSSVLTIVYMFIGGSPGSTAGGIKTTTVAVLIIASVALIRRKENTVAFKRRFDAEAVFQASTVLLLYLGAILFGILTLSAVEAHYSHPSLLAVALEVVSATGTVGLSQGLTPLLTGFSQVVLCLLMFFGRLGGYTLALVFSAERKAVRISYPKENVMIG